METGEDKELKFIKYHPGAPNEILSLGENAFVSYNPDRHLFGLKIFAGDNFSDETALVLIQGDHRKYYILNGDFRQEYINAFKSGGIEACCKLFAERQQKFGSTWTSHSDPDKWLRGVVERIVSERIEDEGGEI